MGSSTRGEDSNEDICTAGQTCVPGLRILQEHFSGQDNIFLILRELFVGSAESYARGWHAVQEFHHNGDLSALAMATVLPVPLMKLAHFLYYNLIVSVFFHQEYKDFKTSRFYKSGLFISEGGKIASLIYFTEILTIFVLNVLVPTSTIPKHLVPLQKFPNLFGNIVYGLWLARYATQLKSNLLKSSFARLPDPGKNEICLPTSIFFSNF